MEKLTGLLFLEHLKKLLKEPDHWTKCSFARNEKNLPVEPTSPEACRWCIMGGMDLVAYRFKRFYPLATVGAAASSACQLLFLATRDVAKDQEYPGPMTYNDDGNVVHQDIVQVIDRAIQLGMARLQKRKPS